jgi:pimeloyl-ACP methyl ester carboxylesterase
MNNPEQHSGVEPNQASPHADEFTINQHLVNNRGESNFSLWLPPTNEEHVEGMHARTGRVYGIDIVKTREAQASQRDKIKLEYETPFYATAPTGEKVGLRIVNREAAEATIGVMTPWSTDAEWENVRGYIEELAIEFPNAKIIYIETPGMGGSDSLTNQRMSEMTKTGSFSPIGEQVGSALKAEGIEFDVVVGMSEGARGAISLGEKMGAKQVITMEPPGTEDGFIKFVKQFSTTEAKHQEAIKQETPDREMAEAHGEDGKRLLKNLGAVPGLLKRAYAMSKSGLEADVRSATATGVTIIDYRGEASQISDHTKAEALARDVEGYTTITLPNAPHGLYEINAAVCARLVRQAFALIAAGNVNSAASVNPAIVHEINPGADVQDENLDSQSLVAAKRVIASPPKEEQ